MYKKMMRNCKGPIWGLTSGVAEGIGDPKKLELSVYDNDLRCRRCGRREQNK
jgi:hypothetical protein